MSLEAKDIKTIQDMQNFVKGCINDFETEISTKEETIEYLKDYTLKIIELTENAIKGIKS
jgi:hypothetical protein